MNINNQNINKGHMIKNKDRLTLNQRTINKIKTLCNESSGVSPIIAENEMAAAS